MLKTSTIPNILTIAGTDPSGGAGIQADIKAISATGCYAASVITVLVAQNTQGVQAIQEIPLKFIQAQIDAVFTDLSIAAVKLGMLFSEAIIRLIADNLKKYQPSLIVLDPVMVAQSGHSLLLSSATKTLANDLFPLATLVTPNIPEAEALIQKKIACRSDMESAAMALSKQYKVAVLIKGGHLDGAQSPDVLCSHSSNSLHWFDTPRIDTHHTHGTGCTLSSAIASYLAQGETLYTAIAKAKTYLVHAIESGKNLRIGRGSGPVNHFYFLNIK